MCCGCLERLYRVHGPNSPPEGEVFPRIVREKLLVDFNTIPGFFPAYLGAKQPTADYTLTVPTEGESATIITRHPGHARAHNTRREREHQRRDRAPPK